MPLDALTTDESRWPIVIHSTVGIPNDEDVDAFIRRADAILARRERHAVIFDNTRSGRATPYMRKRSMDWMHASAPLLGEYCVGCALVFRSAAFRFVMSTVMLVTPNPVPTEVCGTLEEAIAWTSRRIDATRRATV